MLVAVGAAFVPFIAVIVFVLTAALAIGKDAQTTVLVPIAVMITVLVAIAPPEPRECLEARMERM
jgi:hypothetical protein